MTKQLNPIADRMIQEGISSLILNRGLPASACWMAAGKPDLAFSNREVNAAVCEGVLTESNGKATVAKAVTDAIKKEKRSASAQKAAATRAAQPPSPSAIRMWHRIQIYGWYEPRYWEEADDCKELLRKGLAMRGEFKTPSGRIFKYAACGSIEE